MFLSLKISNRIICFSYADEVLIDDEVMAQENDGIVTAKVSNVSTLLMSGN